MENIDVIDESVVYLKQIKKYTIMFGECQVEVLKTWDDDVDEMDGLDLLEADYKIINEDEVREELSDTDFDDLCTFITTLD